MSSSWSSLTAPAFASLLLALMAAAGGCVADTAADTDLPWASNQSWEGVMPLPSGALNQYD